MLSRTKSIEHAREGDCLTDVFDATHPRGAAFDSHTEAGVRNAAVSSKVEIPLEYLLRKVVVFQLFFEVFKRSRAFASADDLAVALGSEKVDTQGQFRTFLVDLEIESFNCCRKMVNEYRLAELVRKICLVGGPEVAAPFKI